MKLAPLVRGVVTLYAARSAVISLCEYLQERALRKHAAGFPADGFPPTGEVAKGPGGVGLTIGYIGTARGLARAAFGYAEGGHLPARPQRAARAIDRLVAGYPRLSPYSEVPVGFAPQHHDAERQKITLQKRIELAIRIRDLAKAAGNVELERHWQELIDDLLEKMIEVRGR